ncbi:FtsW/RodA/SpoVE family cell cycle protein [Roseibacillus persicicus]|uniref:Rod shape-determining protein RodA n=1 Tax=Roseibacillus persicicus TaxID=454148 RepID=A0A918WG07_9BACT|nr:FtsW/RodA/SpoVE family cell cycle protein [Roseibacillus persicicus]MDQ8191219.1 FtsW/RodA/SpoVE family cell cycle protein [Roseibacillus persicicus]GHC47967.1 rod shape-determining protein RodA [Roseibacillus persicicus]
MTPLLRKILGLNWVLVIVMFGLLVFGVFSIDSAARHLPGGGERFANNQKMFILLGSAVYFCTALIDYRWVKWLAIPMYLGGVGLQGMLMAGIWEAPEPAVHQLMIPGIPFSFQPTTFVLAAGIILMGTAFDRLPRLHRFFAEPIVKLALVGLICGVPFLMVIKNGDMGSAIVFLPVAFVTLLVGGVPFRYLSALMLTGVGLLPIIYYLVLPEVSDRATGRIDQYLEFLKEGKVEKSAETYASYYVSLAVGQAGWKGMGYKAKAERGSIHDKRYIPWTTAHNDYIFAVIAEEQGFRGSLLMLTSFALLLIQMLFVAFYSRDFLGQVVSAGVVAMFFAHIFESVGMCVLLMPITGIPLPLISYSGTFVLICMFLLGLVQSVWVHRNELSGIVDGRQERPH